MEDDVLRIEAKGILFGGDLHLSSRAPSRRKDDYMAAGLDKVRQLVAIANENRFVLVLTGDVFHRSHETNEALKTRLLRELAQCWHFVLTNVGNHDKAGDRLGDADTLSVIGEPGAPLRVFAESGPAALIDMDGTKVGLGFTPYGQEIPSDVRDAFGGEAAGTVWCTHHDVAFDGAYPGALVPHAIQGCQLVVNGHMHLEKAPVQAGQTMWCNFGSLMRTAIDAVSHEPCAWSFRPGGMTRHPLRFTADVFDLSSRLVDQASPGELVAAASGGAFVEMLEAARAEAVPATADGTLLLEALRSHMEGAGSRPEVRAMVLDLHRRAVEKRAAAGG